MSTDATGRRWCVCAGGVCRRSGSRAHSLAWTACVNERRTAWRVLVCVCVHTCAAVVGAAGRSGAGTAIASSDMRADAAAAVWRCDIAGTAGSSRAASATVR